jgi:hypothetical protein
VCTSDISLLRLKVNNLERVSAILEQKGYTRKRTGYAIAVSKNASINIEDIVSLIREEAIDANIIAMLPCIYQG